MIKYGCDSEKGGHECRGRQKDSEISQSRERSQVRINPKTEEVLPDGWYHATIGEVEEKETKFGDRLMVPFDVEAGDGAVVDITAFISFSDHPKSNVVKWGKALFGERAFDTDEFTDVQCEVFVEEGEDSEGQPKNFIRKVRPLKGDREPKAPESGKEEADVNDEDFDQIPF